MSGSPSTWVKFYVVVLLLVSNAGLAKETDEFNDRRDLLPPVALLKGPMKLGSYTKTVSVRMIKSFYFGGNTLMMSPTVETSTVENSVIVSQASENDRAHRIVTETMDRARVATEHSSWGLKSVTKFDSNEADTNPELGEMFLGAIGRRTFTTIDGDGRPIFFDSEHEGKIGSAAQALRNHLGKLDSTSEPTSTVSSSHATWVGDQWNSRETMEGSDYLNVTNTLLPFTKVQGHDCAVVEASGYIFPNSELLAEVFLDAGEVEEHNFWAEKKPKIFNATHYSLRYWDIKSNVTRWAKTTVTVTMMVQPASDGGRTLDSVSSMGSTFVLTETTVLEKMIDNEASSEPAIKL